MPSANNLYQTIMSSLQEMNLQPELKDFLKQQSLSIMRGIQISDDDKIQSMLILLNAAALVEIDTTVFNAKLLNQLILEVNKNLNSNIDEYKPNVAASINYIEKLLNQQIDKKELKNEYNGKPWLLHDKTSISPRIPLGLKKPESNVLGSGLIPTKNDKGWEFPSLESDIFNQQFQAAISGENKKRALILGAGYGTFAYDLLESSKHNKSKFVINDLSSEQMEVFKDQLPVEFDSRVTVISGNFLDEINFPDNHFDQILLQNVMHFFTPEQVDICLSRIYSWLKPGGILTVTTSTPHWGILKDYVPIFELKKESGDEWPGFIPNLKALLEEQNNPIAGMAPNGPIHNFDESTLNSNLLKHNFQLSRSGFFAMPNTFPKPFQGNGKEYVGAEAYKPKV